MGLHNMHDMQCILLTLMTLLTLLYSAYTAHTSGASVVLNKHVHEKEGPKNRSNPSRYSDLHMPSSIKASSSHQVHKVWERKVPNWVKNGVEKQTFNSIMPPTNTLKKEKRIFSDIREAWRELRIFV